MIHRASVTLSLSLSLFLPRLALAQTDTPPTREAPEASQTEESRALAQRLDALLGRTDGITSDTVAHAAAGTSFDLRARREDIAAAVAGVDQALAAYLPRLSLMGRYTRLSDITLPSLGNLVAAPSAAPGLIAQGTPLLNVPLSFVTYFPDNFTLEATLAIPVSDYLFRLPQSYSAARSSVRAAELTALATRLRVETDARLAYYTWVRARLQVAVAEQALEQAHGHLTDVRHSFDVGVVSRADVLRVESQVATAELLVARARSLESVTSTSVQTAMHTEAPRTMEIGEDVRGDIPGLAGATTADALVDEAYHARAELQSLEVQANALRDQARATRGSAYPRLDALGEVQYSDPNSRYFPPQQEFAGSWSLGAQITWSPNDALTASAAGRQIEARMRGLLEQRQAAMDGIRAEVVAAWEAAREAEAAVASGARGLASAEEGYRVRRELFRNGRATSVELTDAETDLTHARLDALNARVDQRVARVRLLHATGRDER